MKQCWLMRLVVAWGLIFSTFLGADIIEIGLLEELNDYIKPGALVMFDISNTLIEPLQTLGSDQWLSYRVKEHQKQGKSYQEAFEKGLSEWIAIQNLTKMKSVEPSTAALIKGLQLQKIPVMGITKRGYGVLDCTFRQLESVGINLGVTSPCKQDLVLSASPLVFLRKGIIFTCGADMGEAFQSFLSNTKFKPNMVVLVNDKAVHLREVEKVCGKQGIPFIGLRYGYLDSKVKDFRGQVAEVQMHHFGRLLSDEAAERILLGK